MSIISRYWRSVQCLASLILVASLLLGCGQEAPPPTAQIVAPPPTSPSYLEDIQPIFNRRCIACHGCLGSPCNLKLDSFRGVDRGGFGFNPYSVHFSSYPRVDMDIVPTTEDWRKRGFYPVLERGATGPDRLAGSLLHQMVKAGYEHNQPGFSREALMPLYRKRYDHQCPSNPGAAAPYLAANPAAGMPFGLPAISRADFEQLTAWVENDSPGPTAEELRTAAAVRAPAAVAQWETFFNDPDPRSRLVARFIFDHVFLASIVLEESPGDFFRLVRSKTPPTQTVREADGQEQTVARPVEVIATPLPYDNPYDYAGVTQFWYRLEKITTPIVQKNHFVWRLRARDIDHLKDLFLKPAWEDTHYLNPPWGIGNPFRIYRAIPAEARARFLLENAELIVSGVTYGPVCLGQTATYAVKDHFWVYFIDPRFDPSVQRPELGLDTWSTMMDRSLIGDADYADAYGATLARLTPKGFPIEAIWKGDGHNDQNAWLTVLRHETNVSVLKGRQGGIPNTQWLIGYSGFERLYYDTVASFKYWEGDVSKLETLGFFNLLRQELEDNFLLLLPRHDRQPIRKQWSQGIGAVGRALVPFAGESLPGRIKENRHHPLLGLIERIQAHLGPAISGPVDELNPRVKPQVSLDSPLSSYEDWVKAVSTLTTTTHYRFPRFLPSVVLLRLNHGAESRVYSLIANRAYKTQFDMVFQNGEALPDEDTLSVYPTIIGGFPNLLMEFDLAQAADFLRSLRAVETLEDWAAVRNRYGILRNSERFWPALDWFNDWNFSHRGEDAGYLDLSYYDLLDTVY